MRTFVILLMLLVSSSAQLMRPGASGSGGNGGPSTSGGNGGQMPDMGFVMTMVRQILMSLLPKLMANPSLMSSIVSGKLPLPGLPPMGSPASPPRPPSPSPMGGMAGNFGGPPMGGNPIPIPMMGGRGGNPMMGGRGSPFRGMNPMNVFGPSPSPAANMGAMGGGVAPGYMPMTSSDTMKDMRLLELLRDPTVGLHRDPYVQQYIPRGNAPWGWSLPDFMKDQIMYAIRRRVVSRGRYTPKEHEIVSLIGDPVEKMPAIFGPGSRYAPPMV